MGAQRAIVLKIDSHPNNVALIGLAVHAYCDHFFDGEFSDEVELGIVEALNNVIEHGYQNQFDQPIQVRLELSEQSLVCQIRDFGVQWCMRESDGQELRQEGGETALEDIPEGGFGLFLIRQVMDHVDLRAENPGSMLTLKKFCRPKSGVGDEA